MPKASSGDSWKDAVREALELLGGEAHLRQINHALKNHPKTRTNPTWKDTIRRVVRQYSIFEPVPPDRSGRYRLVEAPVLPEPQHEKAGHSSAQGMLLRLGLLYGFETFAPASDRTSRMFQGRSLSDLATVNTCEGFCKSKSGLRKVEQIDAIWLLEDADGPYPAYAFEVEHTTRVRSGIDRLTEIPERFKVPLFVIGPGAEEKRLFDSLAAQNRYRRFREQLLFRDYAALESLFNAAVTHDETQNEFGVAPRFGRR